VSQEDDVDDWDLSEAWTWLEDEDEIEDLYETAEELAELFFLCDPAYFPEDGDEYNLGYLDASDWWPLVRQLDDLEVNLDFLLELAYDLEPLLGFPGLPTEILEGPLGFLQSGLLGNLPLLGSEKRIGSRRLVKIAKVMVDLALELSESARVATQAWANVHRNMIHPFSLDEDGMDLDELLSGSELPPAVVGFSMVIGMTLMRWPERGEGLPLAEEMVNPELYDSLLDAWETLPEIPTVTEEGVSGAEALFAQGQLAHTLAQMATVEGLDVEEMDNDEMARAYSRLSRSILWLHNQCRRCPERDGVGCLVARVAGVEQPVPLLDVASVIANQGRVEGCIYM
jgi:hypothetical protein